MIGGTSARSSGTVWVPNNHLMSEAGFPDDPKAAATYLDDLVGERQLPALRSRFLSAAPKMLKAFESELGIWFRPFLSAPDYRQNVDGAAVGGRALEPPEFDGRLLEDDFAKLAPPIPELMVFGGMMVTRAEAARLLKADSSIYCLGLAIRLVCRFLWDRLTGKARGTRLVLGNALVARLFFEAKKRSVEVLTNCKPLRLRVGNDQVVGVEVSHQNETRIISIARGVVLAGGGFPGKGGWCQQHLPNPTPEFTPAAETCDGSSIQLGLDAGGKLGPSGHDNGLWFPSSIATRKDGSTAVYPHIVLDRSKPGSIIVNSQGQRFANEAVSYHEFVRAMYAQNRPEAKSIPAWMICTRDFIAKYGLGLIRPRTPVLTSYVKGGYLKTGATLEELAARLNLPTDKLQETIAQFNAFARAGEDGDFQRGKTIYDQSNGDPRHKPNPCLGELVKGPFYAVALYPTPLGTSRGLVTNEFGQVLNAEDKPINGLYACGNDMQSAFGGEYPGAGAQLGQGMTFGWLAGRHAAGILDNEV